MLASCGLKHFETLDVSVTKENSVLIYHCFVLVRVKGKLFSPDMHAIIEEHGKFNPFNRGLGLGCAAHTSKGHFKHSGPDSAYLGSQFHSWLHFRPAISTHFYSGQIPVLTEELNNLSE